MMEVMEFEQSDEFYEWVAITRDDGGMLILRPDWDGLIDARIDVEIRCQRICGVKRSMCMWFWKGCSHFGEA
jgi:hypothetical protein